MQFQQGPTRSQTLVLYASIGSGHRSAAEAIASAIELRAASDVQVRLVDVMRFLPLPRGELLSRHTTSQLGSLFYDAIWDDAGMARLGQATIRSFRSVLARVADRILTPDVSVVVSTHALGAIVMQCARSAAVKIAALTDFMPHAYWPLRNVDLYCLATAEAVATFEQRGVDTSCLAMTGIPVSHAFTQSRSKEDARRRLSLPNDRVVALVVAGARQSGPYATMVKGLLADCRHDDFGGATLVVLTGENRILRNHLESLGRSDLFAVGYTSEVADYMAAADLLFCKPGGVSLAECLTQGRPLILWGSGHGQERANSSLLVSKGAVALMGSREPVGHWIRKLTNDPTAFDDMCARSMALARPDAAATIADLVLTRIGGRRIHVDEGPSANTARYQHLHGSRSR